jgi:UDP-D-galactose:(glucosyl)LPS alpha-1,3-D-galactosyltransferase
MNSHDTHVLGYRPPIVCGVDQNYLAPLHALMSSLAVAHPEARARPRLIVLHQQLAASCQLEVVRRADALGLEVDLREVAPPDDRYPLSGWISNAVYLRLSVADAIDDESTVLYLDADTMIRDDLGPLLSTDLGGTMLAAVRDPQNPLIGHGIALPGWEALGLPACQEYFNSGVMLLNLPQCRRQGLFEKAREFLLEHPGCVRFWDQDALNWAAADQWMRLDRRWNTVALSPLAGNKGFVHHAEAVLPLSTLLDDEKTAAVLHFAGPDKPWNDDYPQGPIRNAYRALLDSAGGQAS